MVIVQSDGTMRSAPEGGTEAIASLARELIRPPPAGEAAWLVRADDGEPVMPGTLPLARAWRRREAVGAFVLCADSAAHGRRIIAVSALPLARLATEDAAAVVAVTDITALAREDNVRALRRALNELLATSLDFEPTLAQAARLMVPTLADWCTIDVVAEDGELHRVAAAHRREDRESPLRESARADTPVGVPWSAIRGVARTGRPLLKERVIPGEPRASQASGEGTTPAGGTGRVPASGTPPKGVRAEPLVPVSYLCVPLVARGKCFAIVSLAYSDPGRHYDENDLELVEDLCARLALAVHGRPQTSEHEMRWAAELATLRATRLQVLTATLAELDEVEEVGRLALEHAMAAVGAAAGFFSLFDVTGKSLELAAAAGLPRDALARLRRVSLAARLPFAAAARTGKVVAIESPEEVEATFPELAAMLPPHLTESLVSIPLAPDGRAIGVLGFCFSHPRTLSDTDREFMIALGRESGRAFERARQHEVVFRAGAEAASEARRLAFLASASDVLGRSLDYRQTVGNVVALAVPTLADACIVYATAADGTLRQADLAHDRTEVPQALLDLLQQESFSSGLGSVVADAVRTREPRVIPEITEAMLREAARDSGELRAFEALGVTGLMVFPLVTRESPIGAVAFVALSPERKYTPADLSLARQLAERAAVAIDNSSRFSSSQEVQDSQTAFMTLLSRDLRTPLTSISGYAELLLLGIPEPLPEAARAQVERVQHASQQLLALIESIGRALPDAPQTPD